MSASLRTPTCLVLVMCPLLRAQVPALEPAPSPPCFWLEEAFLAGPRLPERVEVNGRIVVVADLVQQARTVGIADDLVARHCLEQLVLTVLRDRLVQQQAWLDDAAYERAYAAYAAPYDSTPFTVEVVATFYKGYPSLECFQQRWRVMESCARSLPKDALDDASLAAEAARSRDLLAGSGIEVELWFHEAAPGEHGQRDFAAARRQALATHAALLAAKGNAPELAADVVAMHLGAGQPILLNQLRQALRESEYTNLLREGVADALFRAEPGQLLAPLRGAYGVYVARVVRKVEGKNKVDPKHEGMRKLLQQMLVQHRFREWVDAALAKAVVRLPQEEAWRK